MDTRISRRDLLKTAAVTVPALALTPREALASVLAGEEAQPGMNILIFMTDQERYIQHFPDGWEEENMPGMNRLKANGVSFDNACVSACMCSPSRASFFTGNFPAQHGVKYTLEDAPPSDDFPQVELPLDLPNMATVMSAAGYNVIYKGKWHLSRPEDGGEFAPDDVDKYGFMRWNPPDAGANQDADQAGGGEADNDGRFIDSEGTAESGNEGVIDYLNSEAAQQQPFCLIVSLVNPHDVLFYPRVLEDNGYDDSWLVGSIEAPSTAEEDLLTKPFAQQQFRIIANTGLGPLPTPEQRNNYMNFYGNLMKASDNYLVEILDTLQSQNLLDNTLVIKTSDHGEMGLSHNMRQKNFNMYEETLRVPLIFSNPQMYDGPYRSSTMVSHVDFLPTLASMFNVPDDAKGAWQGIDYSARVLEPSDEPVQDYVLFTYDDYQSGQPTPPYPGPRNRIVALREERYKIAEYHDEARLLPSQYEMYDRQDDPLELNNLAFDISAQSSEVQQEFERLKAKLEMAIATRLQPFDDPGGAFNGVWERTDKPVLDGDVSRTWMWGPEPLTPPITEPYDEAPSGQRFVQYFDKARMEITNPDQDPNSIWYVTNGLLVAEMVTGQMQVGDARFVDKDPAEIPVAGDPVDPAAPSYATFGTLLDEPPLELGSVITQRTARGGTVLNDPVLALWEVTVGYIDEVTNHSIATPFWEFMNSSGLIWDGEENVDAPLFENPFYATGRPITEPYWATVLLDGNPRDILMQCFERRVMTFAPRNDPAWQVEAGNVGLHYRRWRYGPGDFLDLGDE